MSQTIISSRKFNQDLAAAKRAAKDGPVVVTDRGEPAFVLMTHKAYRQISGQAGRSIVDMLRHPESDDIEFEPVRLDNSIVRPADLS